MVEEGGEGRLELCGDEEEVEMKIIALQITTVICGCLMFFSAACANQPTYGVTPTKIAAGSKVTVSLPKKHPQGFAIETPDGDWIYIVDPSLHYSFIPDFYNKALFTFPEDTLQGVRFVNGKQAATKVFDKPGQYKFYFADNLETEPENTFSLSYTVTYQQ